MSPEPRAEVAARIARAREPLVRLREEVAKVVVGQDELIDRLILGLLCGGHVLLEGPPGVGKTLAVRTLAAALALQFQRVQFTPDLLPADLTGTSVLHPQSGEFSVRKGPLFTQILLADEINRAPPKVQSALLEAMQERQVTIQDQTLALPDPFLVLATQNPLEHEGTFRLPEAERDRFLFLVKVGYPSDEAERELLRRHGRVRRDTHVEAVFGGDELSEIRALVDEVYVDERLLDYVARLVRASREPASVGLDDWQSRIDYGASPRGSLALLIAARGHALLNGRDYASPNDVKSVAVDVLRHRILLGFEAEARGVDPDDAVAALLGAVEVT